MSSPASSCGTEEEFISLYLDLVKKSVTHSLFSQTAQLVHRPRGSLKRAIIEVLRKRGISLVHMHPFRDDVDGVGRQWPVPAFAQTMVGHTRLDHVQGCIESILDDGVAGDLIETGVWRGGTGIVMRATLKAHGVTDRDVWMADSFRGLPPPNTEVYPEDATSTLHEINTLSVSVEEVRANFARYGLLDEQVRFVEGWFRDTLPGLRDRQWALIRLDGDLYESTMDGLLNLYPGLSQGGYLIVDDYFAYEPCKKATDDFRRDHGIDDPLEQIDWTCVAWRRMT